MLLLKLLTALILKKANPFSVIIKIPQYRETDLKHVLMKLVFTILNNEIKQNISGKISPRCFFMKIKGKTAFLDSPPVVAGSAGVCGKKRGKARLPVILTPSLKIQQWGRILMNLPNPPCSMKQLYSPLKILKQQHQM